MTAPRPARAWLLTTALLLAGGCGPSDDDTATEPPDPAAPAGPDSPPAVPAAANDEANPFTCRGCNLVFVSFDALQARHVTALGYPRNVTPTIDSVADEGFLFRRHTSVASWTVPSSMTWFTGVYPSEHRMVNKYAVYDPPNTRLADLRELSPNLVTLADVLKSNGYATAGFTGNAGVSGGFGYEQGFDVYYNPTKQFGRFDGSVPRALAWLREHADERFFLFLHGYDVHGQALPATGLDHRFVDEDYDGRYLGRPREQEVLREQGLETGRVELRDEDVQFWRAVYDEKIQRADEQFRIFLTEFERLGLADNTLFVLTSDHGTELHEHGRFDHGFTLYDELLHVPLVVRLPMGRERVDVDARTSSIDLMPTILDLLDVEVTERVRRQLRGRSLVPTLRGRHEPRPVFSETNYREYTYKRAIVDEQGWKLIHTLETGTDELYDLDADPDERTDVAALHPVRTAGLRRRLFDHFADIGHDLTAREWRTGLNPVYPSQGIEDE